MKGKLAVAYTRVLDENNKLIDGRRMSCYSTKWLVTFDCYLQSFVGLWHFPFDRLFRHPWWKSAEILERKADEECQHCNVSFWVTKLTRTHIEGTLERFKLTADELTKRQRQGRFMQFINYDELYIKVLTIDQHLNTKIVKFDMNEIIPLTSNDTVALTSFDDNTRVSNNVVKQTESKVLGNTLSRVLVDEVKINFKPPKYQPVVLTANHAKMLTDTMIMQFEGNVTLEAAKCKISLKLLSGRINITVCFSQNPINSMIKHTKRLLFFR